MKRGTLPAKGDNRFEYVAAFFVMAAFGFFGILVRWVGLPGKEQYVVFWRVLFGLALVSVVMLATRQTRQLKLRGSYLLLLLNGAFFAAQSYSSTRAIYLLPVSDAIFIIYLAPVLVAAFAPLVLKEKLEKMTIPALAVALAGLGLISFSQNTGAKPLNLAGVGFALLSAACYTGTVLTLKMLREKLPSLTIYFYASLVLLALLFPSVGFRIPEISSKGWLALAALGILSGSLSIIYVHIVKKVKAQHIGVISYMDPVSATFLAFIFLGETPGWQDYLGAGLIIAAGVMVLSRWSPFAERQVE